VVERPVVGDLMCSGALHPRGGQQSNDGYPHRSPQEHVTEHTPHVP